jgi:hypothetical protein
MNARELVMVKMLTPADLLAYAVQDEENPDLEFLPIPVMQYLVEDYIDRYRIAHDARAQGNDELAEAMERVRSMTRQMFLDRGFPRLLDKVNSFIQEEDRIHRESLREKLKEVGEFN